MGTDEALLRTAEAKEALPTLRIYAWSQPTVSVGYRQSLADALDLPACRRLGLDWVRRLTGGRAVVHDQEVTYSFAGSRTGIFGSFSVREAYRWVHRSLRAALEGLGIRLDPPEPTRRAPEPPESLPCFAVASGHEITVNQRKLVGSAQKWTRRAFLQHGSILLDVDEPLWARATRAPLQAMQAVGLYELAAGRPDHGILVEALEREFEMAFGEPASESRLSPKEARIASWLAREKYGSSRWTLGRSEPETGEPAKGET